MTVLHRPLRHSKACDAKATRGGGPGARLDQDTRPLSGTQLPASATERMAGFVFSGRFSRRFSGKGGDRFMEQRSIEVGVLGATGVVGQHFVSRAVAAPVVQAGVAGGQRTLGRQGLRATPRRGGWPRRCRPRPPPAPWTPACRAARPKIVFSGLDASVAGEVEGAFAAAGHIVVSNARNYRMDPLVPLLIPEVNADHLGVLAEQRARQGLDRRHRHQSQLLDHRAGLGAGAAAPVRPQPRGRDARCRRSPAPAIRACRRSTSSATSCPFIGGEEEKMEIETQKILGGDGGRVAARGA